MYYKEIGNKQKCLQVLLNAQHFTTVRKNKKMGGLKGERILHNYTTKKKKKTLSGFFLNLKYPKLVIKQFSLKKNARQVPCFDFFQILRNVLQRRCRRRASRSSTFFVSKRIVPDLLDLTKKPKSTECLS